MKSKKRELKVPCMVGLGIYNYFTCCDKESAKSLKKVNFQNFNIEDRQFKKGHILVNIHYVHTIK